MSIETLKRAFELADEGTFRNVKELREALNREDLEHVNEHLSGAAIRKQLTARLNASGLHLKKA